MNISENIIHDFNTIINNAKTFVDEKYKLYLKKYNLTVNVKYKNNNLNIYICSTNEILFDKNHSDKEYLLFKVQKELPYLKEFCTEFIQDFEPLILSRFLNFIF